MNKYMKKSKVILYAISMPLGVADRFNTCSFQTKNNSVIKWWRSAGDGTLPHWDIHLIQEVQFN